MPIVDLMATEDLSGLFPLWEVSIEEYRYVFFSGNRIEVYKPDSSSPAYTITKDGCSCRAAQYGNANCKHRVSKRFVGDGGISPATVNKQKRANALSDDYNQVQNINDLL